MCSNVPKSVYNIALFCHPNPQVLLMNKKACSTSIRKLYLSKWNRKWQVGSMCKLYIYIGTRYN